MAQIISAIVVNDGRLANINYLKNSASGAVGQPQVDKFYLKEFWLLNGISGTAVTTKYWDPLESPVQPDNIYQYRLAVDSNWLINNRTAETGNKLRLTLVVPNAYSTGSDTIDGIAVIAEDMNGDEFLYAYGTISEGPNKPSGFDLSLYMDIQF